MVLLAQKMRSFVPTAHFTNPAHLSMMLLLQNSGNAHDPQPSKAQLLEVDDAMTNLDRSVRVKPIAFCCSGVSVCVTVSDTWVDAGRWWEVERMV